MLYKLTGIGCGLSVSRTFLSDIGLLQSPAKSTMSDGNKKRSYKVYQTIPYTLPLRSYRRFGQSVFHYIFKETY